MYKTIRDNKACFVFESVKELDDFVQALYRWKELMVEEGKKVYKIKPETVSATILIEGDIEQLQFANLDLT